MESSKKLKITLIKSKFGLIPNHVLCVKALGLKHIHHSVVRENTPSVMGVVKKISYLLKVENA